MSFPSSNEGVQYFEQNNLWRQIGKVYLSNDLGYPVGYQVVTPGRYGDNIDSADYLIIGSEGLLFTYRNLVALRISSIHKYPINDYS